MTNGQVAGVSPVAKIDKVHLDWQQRQADKKKAAAKPGNFAAALKKAMEKEHVIIKSCGLHM
jgi:hypothetical protein